MNTFEYYIPVTSKQVSLGWIKPVSTA